MTKKHFIALADMIRNHNDVMRERFTQTQIDTLANFCADANVNFNRERWLAYVAGKCGKNGGAR